MIDSRAAKLAHILVNYSCGLKEGERVLIESFDVPEELVIELVRAARKAGAVPLVSTKHYRVMRSLYEGATEDQFRLFGDIELHRMERMDAYIGVRGGYNSAEMSDVDPEKLKIVSSFHAKPVHLERRVKHTKWVVLRWPTPAMAQQANMSTEAFEDFFFRVCTLDYSRMSNAMGALVEWMSRTDEVHITGPGTDVIFSIRGIPIEKCDGRQNIPDGEVFTAPVRDSVNGVIQFNTPTIFQGSTFSDVRLELREGKIIGASASTRQDSSLLNNILDSDEGARYLGEFAIGLNPYITKPMKDTLFDEKIAGSVHLTPGQAYETADNGNRSQIHWDMVLIQTEAYGGGEMTFDGALVRKNGTFVVPELQGLNPDQLA